MSQSRRSRDGEAHGAQEGYDAAALSELTVQPPVDWIEAQQQGNVQPLYGGDNGDDEMGMPLAELVSGPPSTRTSSTPSTRRAARPPSTAGKAPEDLPPVSKLATKLYIVSYLIFFSILGTLARLGLQALTFYPGAPVVTGVLWANVGGCILMGFLLEDRNLFQEEWGTNNRVLRDLLLSGEADAAAAWVQEHKTVKKTIPLYIGLTTGFCGSLTSFSSFMRDVFLALSNDLPDPSSGATTIDRHRGDSFMAAVAVILVTVSLSMSSLFLGAHLAIALDPWTPIVPFQFTRKVLDRAAVLFAWGCWLGAIFMAIWPPDRMYRREERWRGQAIFAIVFGPLGSLFRFYVSLHLNARIPTFPLGTFAVNIVGTAIVGMCYDLQHVAGIGAASVASRATGSVLVSCQVLQGVMDGFCGCCTTVSTWVAELSSLGRRRHSYVYGTMSVGVALALLAVIMGSLRWTIGFTTPVCS